MTAGGDAFEPANPLRIDVFTVFPDMFEAPLGSSIVGRARNAGLLELHVHDIRNWTTDRHRTTDDKPYGGGAGMVMMAPPIVEAVEATLGDDLPLTRVLIMSAAGGRFTQAAARAFAGTPRLALICGHYEGIDHRVTEILGAEEWSIGDYVLTGGEIPAMVIVDAVTRLVPGVIDSASTADESHTAGLLEYPQYTRPPIYRGLPVPDVLLSGHHAEIAKWRHQQALDRTERIRPDLYEQLPPPPVDEKRRRRGRTEHS